MKNWNIRNVASMERRVVGIIMLRGWNIENMGDEDDIITRSRSTWNMGKADTQGAGITITHPGILPMRMDIGMEDVGNVSSEACCAICCSTHCVMVPNMAMK